MKMDSQRSLGWLPTVTVLIVVVLAGSRLIYLSVQHHGAVARQTAAGLAASFAAKIEPQLQNLAAACGRQAAAAAQALAERRYSDVDGIIATRSRHVLDDCRRQGSACAIERGCDCRRDRKRMGVGGVRAPPCPRQRCSALSAWGASGSWQHAPSDPASVALARAGPWRSQTWMNWSPTVTSAGSSTGLRLRAVPGRAAQRPISQLRRLEHRVARRCSLRTHPPAGPRRNSRELSAGCDPPQRRLVSDHVARLGNRAAGVSGLALRLRHSRSNPRVAALARAPCRPRGATCARSTSNSRRRCSSG